MAAASSPSGRSTALTLLRTRLVNSELFDPARVKAASWLSLRRDRDRKFDPLAIAVVDEQGHGLGYLPPTSSRSLAALMDAGLHLWASPLPDSVVLHVDVLCDTADLAFRSGHARALGPLA